MNVLRFEKDITEISIAARMQWASRRSTTRIEDEAYCLFGIFGINMPTLYGEGRNAFYRLQEEILRTSSDTSLFSWGSCDYFTEYEALERAVPTNLDSVTQSQANRQASYLFAPSPSNFSESSDVIFTGSGGPAGITASLVSSIRRIQHYTVLTRLSCRVLNTQRRDLLLNPWYTRLQ